ncbi:MAG: RNA polymerase sigma factor [Planctomycetota bacterium JB042]
MQRSRAHDRRGERSVRPAPSVEAVCLEGLLRTGDRDAAFELLSRCTDRLRGYLRMRFEDALGGRTGVEEIVSAAIWKAIEHGDRYRPSRGEPAFWLWRIGVHLAQDELRKRAVRRRHESGAAVRETRRPGRGEEELARAVRELIAALPDPRHRAILDADLAHGGLAPARALAEEFGLAEQTVLNLRREARVALRPRLERLLHDGA